MQPRQTVLVVPYEDGGYDDYGNPVEGYGDPVPTLVYGWAPAGTQELTGWQSTVTADLHLYATADFGVGPQDKVVVVGLDYHVEGEIEDFNHGPFGWAPGVRVNLRRVTG